MAAPAHLLTQLRDSTDSIREMAYHARRMAALPTYVRRRLAVPPQSSASLRIPRETGFAVCPPGTFAEVPRIVSAAKAAFEARRGSGVQFGKGSKKFLVGVLDPAEIVIDSPFVQFALREDVIAAVSAYLGMVPVLRSIAVLYSEAGEAPPSSSQLYHCDGADLAQIKVFVLCSEVTPQGGPLTILDAATSADVRQRAKYRYKDRLTDEQVDAVAGARRPHALVGPPETTCFVDTSRCFHYGSRVSAQSPPRLVTVIQYLTPFYFAAGSERTVAPLAQLARHGLTPLQQLTLGTDLQ